MLPAARDLRGERPDITIRQNDTAVKLRLTEGGSGSRGRSGQALYWSTLDAKTACYGMSYSSHLQRKHGLAAFHPWDRPNLVVHEGQDLL